MSRSVLPILAALAVGGAALGGGLAAQQGAPPATVRGVIFSGDDLRPVADAELLLDGVVVGRSDSAGTFRFTAPSGAHTLTVRRVGYAPTVAELLLQPGDLLEIGVTLPPHAVNLDPVVVEGRRAQSPRLQEFSERRERFPTGKFLTRDELDRYPERRLSDIFRSVQGVSVTCIDRWCTAYKLGPSGRVPSSLDPRAGACDLQVYLDGVPFFMGPQGIDELDPDVVAAIEVYVGASRVPAEFETRNARCGVVAIWTRDGSEPK